MAGPRNYTLGFNPHLPSLYHRLLAKALGGTMWFFILFRAREDGAKFMGWSRPWEHDHEDAHGHGEEHD